MMAFGCGTWGGDVVQHEQVPVDSFSNRPISVGAANVSILEYTNYFFEFKTALCPLFSREIRAFQWELC
jgi:hypothetical protein